MSFPILSFLVAAASAAPQPIDPFANPGLIPASGAIGNCSFITGDFHFHCIPLYVAYLIQLTFGMIGGFALMELIKGGYQVMWSNLPGGDKEGGKNRIKNALVGFAVSLLVFTLIDLILSVVVG